MTALTPEQLTELRERAARAKPTYGYGGWAVTPPWVPVDSETLVELLDHYTSETPLIRCLTHIPVQHRDGKKPWCETCGMTADGIPPTGPLNCGVCGRAYGNGRTDCRPDPKHEGWSICSGHLRGQWISQDVLRDWTRVIDERDQLRVILQRVADVQPVEHTHWDGSGAWLVYDAEEIKQALKGES